MTSSTFFFFFIPFLAFVLLAVNFIFAPHNPYLEKNGAFECGFTSFLGQNRTQFSISFFIFALLFLLFDLEILLVYPYLVSSYINESYGLVVLLMFLLALTLGFVFELGKKALTIDSRQTIQNKLVGVHMNLALFIPGILVKRAALFISSWIKYKLTIFVVSIIRKFVIFIIKELSIFFYRGSRLEMYVDYLENWVFSSCKRILTSLSILVMLGITCFIYVCLIIYYEGDQQMHYTALRIISLSIFLVYLKITKPELYKLISPFVCVVIFDDICCILNFLKLHILSRAWVWILGNNMGPEGQGDNGYGGNNQNGPNGPNPDSGSDSVGEPPRKKRRGPTVRSRPPVDQQSEIQKSVFELHDNEKKEKNKEDKRSWYSSLTPEQRKEHNKKRSKQPGSYSNMTPEQRREYADKVKLRKEMKEFSMDGGLGMLERDVRYRKAARERREALTSRGIDPDESARIIREKRRAAGIIDPITDPYSDTITDPYSTFNPNSTLNTTFNPNATIDPKVIMDPYSNTTFNPNTTFNTTFNPNTTMDSSANTIMNPSANTIMNPSANTIMNPSANTIIGEANADVNANANADGSIDHAIQSADITKYKSWWLNLTPEKREEMRALGSYKDRQRRSNMSEKEREDFLAKKKARRHQVLAEMDPLERMARRMDHNEAQRERQLAREERKRQLEQQQNLDN